MAALDWPAMDSHRRSHTPFVLILLKFLQQWRSEHNGQVPQTRAEKDEFKQRLRTSPYNVGQRNFEEAVANAHRVWVPTAVRLCRSFRGHWSRRGRPWRHGIDPAACVRCVRRPRAVWGTGCAPAPIGPAQGSGRPQMRRTLSDGPCPCDRRPRGVFRRQPLIDEAPAPARRGGSGAPRVTRHRRSGSSPVRCATLSQTPAKATGSCPFWVPSPTWNPTRRATSSCRPCACRRSRPQPR